MSTRKKCETVRRTIEIAACLKVLNGWRVNMSGKHNDPTFSFEYEENGGYSIVDAHDARRDFLAIRTQPDAEALFNRYGPWEWLNNKAGPIRFSALMRARRELEEALLQAGVPPHIYGYVFRRPLTVELPFANASTANMDVAIAHAHDVVSAVRISIFVSRLRELPWKRCKRPDCGKIFQANSKREQVYCDPNCAHLQAVRDSQSRHGRPSKRAKKRGNR